ncbi:TPA: hypothetical protein BOS_25303 [Bos taurus]|nr:TPA: hypothetical protein BOS_25303 [Bos taurus]
MGRIPSSLALPPPPGAPDPLHPPPRRREPENRGEAEARTGGRGGEGTPRPAGPQSPPRAGRPRPEAPDTRPGGQPAGSGGSSTQSETPHPLPFHPQSWVPSSEAGPAVLEEPDRENGKREQQDEDEQVGAVLPVALLSLLL